MDNTAKVQLKQPPALYMLALTASWERFSYYGMRAFLILYLANAVTSSRGGMGFEPGFAGFVYGTFTGLCYLFPLFGGWLADRFLGERRSVLLGGILIMLGHFTCAIDNGVIPLITGLTLLVLGNGFFKPTVVTMIGDLYEQGDKRRDSGFTIYYAIFNGAVFMAPIICGTLGERVGFRYGFIAAGTAMGLGMIIYLIFGPKYLGNLGMVPKHKLHKAETNDTKTPLTKEEKDRIAVIAVIIFFVTFFWAGYEQAGSTFNLYTDKFINRIAFGGTIPTTWFQSINPILVVAFAPLFSWLWISLAKHGKSPSTPVKMAIGMVLLGIGFLFMVGAVMQRGGDNPSESVKASLWWMTATYIFLTMGEMCVSPIGLSMITKIAPAKLASFFMGTWFISSFLANLIAGLTVGFVNKLGAMSVFGGIAVFVAFLGVIVFFLSHRLLAMMHGRD